MVKVVYICEKCEHRYGRPQVTKQKSDSRVPKTECEYYGTSGRASKRRIGTR